MPRTLAIDLGKRRTGLAYLDDVVGVPLPLDTIHHRSEKELLAAVSAVIAERKIDSLLIGLPYLPSGEEGSQAKWVREVSEKIEEFGVPIQFVDERFTSLGSGESDPDAYAALALFAGKK